ncbi:MAG: hypothetical protein ACJAXQ_001299 [Parvibaculaceae bacterium]|jgi:hypothetical protein|tara:strand:- start:915 stop:1019 length:105 start_codon:yes stop_codon:yes gene_type:complete
MRKNGWFSGFLGQDFLLSVFIVTNSDEKADKSDP